MFFPRYPEIAELDLEWYAVPAFSYFLFEVGGIKFPCSPFTGWWTLQEIAIRAYLDYHGFNLSEARNNPMKSKTMHIKSPSLV